jgi:hypothetical protein
MSSRIEPAQHKRFIDYRELHQYFGAKSQPMPWDSFHLLDNEFRELENRKRDDEEEVRFEELGMLLHRN